MDASSRAYVSGYYRSPQIQIGDQIYTSNNINKSDLFFAIYQQPFKAVITDENEVSCFGLSDGMLQVTPYFGRPPFTYSWSHNPGLNNPVANNLPAGEYTVTITDANDSIGEYYCRSYTVGCACCKRTADSSILQQQRRWSYRYHCYRRYTRPGYYYSGRPSTVLAFNRLMQDQTGLTAGTYTVDVEDDNGCSGYC